MTNLDVIFEVALRSNYNTARNLLQQCPQLLFDYDFWYFKCQADFPGKSYFRFWTGELNYLAHKYRYFNIAIYFY